MLAGCTTKHVRVTDHFNYPSILLQKHPMPEEVSLETTQDLLLQGIVDVIQLRSVTAQLNELIDLILFKEGQ